MIKKYIEIGKTKAPHGIKGALKCYVDDAYIEDFFAAKQVVLDLRGTKLPYRIKEIQAGNALIMHLVGIEDRDAAAVLSSKNLYLRAKDILADEERELEAYTSPYAHLDGFLLFDSENSEIGRIDEVREMPGHDMAILTKNGQEIMVPLVEQLILETDLEAKTVKMALPEGLFEL